MDHPNSSNGSSRSSGLIPSTALGSAAGMVAADHPNSSNGSSRSPGPGLSTALCSAAARAPPGAQGRSLAATLVSAMAAVDDRNSSNSLDHRKSSDPGLVAAHALPGAQRQSRSLAATLVLAMAAVDHRNLSSGRSGPGLTTALGSAAARAPSGGQSRSLAAVDYRNLSSGRSGPGLTTALGSAAAHAPPGAQRSLAATLVSAMAAVDDRNSSNSSSRSPGLVANAPPGAQGAQGQSRSLAAMMAVDQPNSSHNSNRSPDPGLSTDLGSAAALAPPRARRQSRSLAAMMAVDHRNSFRGSSRSPDPGLSTGLGSAAAHAPSRAHGQSRSQSRSLAAPLVSAMMVVAAALDLRGPPNGSSRSSDPFLSSLALGSAAAHAPPDAQGQSRSLAATQVSTMAKVDYLGSSRSPGRGLSTALGGSAHAPPSIHGPSHTLTTPRTYRNLYSKILYPTPH